MSTSIIHLKSGKAIRLDPSQVKDLQLEEFHELRLRLHARTVPDVGPKVELVAKSVYPADSTQEYYWLRARRKWGRIFRQYHLGSMEYVFMPEAISELHKAIGHGS